MDTLLQNKAWRRKNSLWLIIAAIPLLNYIAFFYIGYKAKLKRWMWFGIVFLFLSVTIALCLILKETGWLSYEFERSYYWEFWIIYIVMSLTYLISLISAIIIRPDYLKRLAIVQSREHGSHTLLSDRSWSRKKSLWMIWSFIPIFGGFSLIHMGYRTGIRTWKKHGWMYFVAGLICLSLLTDIIGLGSWASWITINHRFNALNIFSLFLVFILYVSNIVQCVILRRSYLNIIVLTWEESRKRWLCLSDKRWRFRNSIWMLWSLLPFCGGASFIQAGIRTGTRSWILTGLAVLAANIANTIVALSGELWSSYYYAILSVLWIATFIGCTIIRERYLEKVAEQYKGDADAAILADLTSPSDQERFRQAVGKRGEESDINVGEASISAALEKRTQNLAKPLPNGRKSKAIPKKKPKAVEEKPVSDKAATEGNPVKPTSANPIDINTCSEQDLMELPGISLADAKRAITYREENGGFASVDAFVSKLNIKPHFAAQIFSIATASFTPVVSSPSRPRRTLDI